MFIAILFGHVVGVNVAALHMVTSQAVVYIFQRDWKRNVTIFLHPLARPARWFHNTATYKQTQAARFKGRPVAAYCMVSILAL